MSFFTRTAGRVGPFAIVGCLLAAAVFIRPQATGLELPSLLIDVRDRFYGVAAPDETALWLVGGDGKIIHSTDEGATWARQDAGVPDDLQDIAAWDAQRALIVGNDGVILRTSDGGTTWTRVEPVIEGFRPAKLMRVKTGADGFAVAVGEYGTVLITGDFGAGWRLGRPQQDVTLIAVAIAGDHVWAAGEYGTLFASADRGASFEEAPKPLEMTVNAIAFADPQRGVAAGLAGTVAVTADGGQTWSAVDTGTLEHLFDVAWTNGSWLAAGDKGVFIRGTAAGELTRTWGPGEIDYMWHTELLPRGEAVFVSGGNAGVLRGDVWTEFKG